MKVYRSYNYSPYYTLAMEELMLKDLNIKENIILIYQHKNAVIIGKNQNAFEEINKENIKSERVELARRISGGGAVFHDMGNINFSFLTNKNKHSYEKFLTPIVNFLKSLGLNACFKGRNDVVIDDMKISGSAQFIFQDRMVHHGTLLFDANLPKIAKMLKPNKLKMESKGIKSVRQRIINIRDTLKKIDNDMNVEEFIIKLIEFLTSIGSKALPFPEKTYKKELGKLIKYNSSEEWIYNKNPKFKVENMKKFIGGILKIKYNVIDGKFKSIAFEGDFLSMKNVEEIEEALVGINYDLKETQKIIETFDISEYFGTIKINEILSLVFGDYERYI